MKKNTEVNMKLKLIYFSLFVIHIFFISCAVKTATINTYVDPNFQSGKIRKIAVFPIRNTRVAPSESQQINRKISMALNQKNPRLEIMSSAEAINTLNENDLADDWAIFLDNYVLLKCLMLKGMQAIKYRQVWISECVYSKIQ